MPPTKKKPQFVSRHGDITVITDPPAGTPRDQLRMVSTAPNGVNVVTPLPAPVVTIGHAYGQGAPMQVGNESLPGETPLQRAMQAGMRRGYLASQEPKAFLPVAAPHYAETTANIAARNIAEQLLGRVAQPSPYSTGYLASAGRSTRPASRE